MSFGFETDYCVVGAGAAGCVVASRLSESGRDQVALIEAGPSDWHPFIHIPATFLHLMHHPRLSWGFNMEPMPGTAGRAIPAPQGKVLGGSSSINGQLFVRGQRAEYDEWARNGCPGWSYEEVLPFFKRIERYEGGADAYHGDAGPMSVMRAREIHPLSAAFVASAEEVGYRPNPDFNAAAREGTGFIQYNRKGRFRAGSAQTFLRRARKRPNIRIETHALARRVLFEGKKAIGVEFSRDGRVVQVRARREVILSCGAIKSPHLLQLSGIGPAQLLRGAGIAVLHDLPGVGQNLVDHFYVRIVHRTRDIATLNETVRGIPLVREVLKYITVGSGLLAHAVTSAALFCRSRAELAAPDLYLSFMPGSYERQGKLEREGGMAIAVLQSHPYSRGTITARSARPEEQPAICPNYLDRAEDQAAMVAGLRIARRLFAASPLARYSAYELRPGAAVEKDDEWVDFVRQRATAGLHFAGSCKMGIDPMAVVAPDLKVHGLQGLRVIDASIMPGCSSGNTNAPTVMIGEKGSDLIRRDRAA